MDEWICPDCGDERCEDCVTPRCDHDCQGLNDIDPETACAARYASPSGPTVGTVIACRQTGLHTVHSNLAAGDLHVAWVSGDDNEPTRSENAS